MPAAPTAQPTALTSHAPYLHQPTAAAPAPPAPTYGGYGGHATYAQPAPQSPYYHQPATAAPAQQAVAYGGDPSHMSYAQPAATESHPPQPQAASAVPDYNQRLGFGTDQGRWLKQQLAGAGPSANPFRQQRHY